MTSDNEIDWSDLTPDEIGEIEALRDDFERDGCPIDRIQEYLDRLPPKLRGPAELELREAAQEFDAYQSTAIRTPEPSEPSALKLPSVPGNFGKYRLEELLGQGAFGCVYRAVEWQQASPQPVAVKVLLPEQIDLAPQFLREAEFARKLDHPHIVKVLATGECDGLPYIAFEFIQGRNLVEWLREHRPTPLEAVELLLPIIEAVGVAHGNGMVHRDLKPANILIDTAGKPHVTDFGLAVTDSEMITGQQQGIAGTYSYMPPEQLEAENRSITERTDVFALGVILYTLLTGAHPWPFHWRRHRDRLQQIRNYCDLLMKRPPKSPQTINPAVSDKLAHICLKALQRDPFQRYTGCAEFAAELRRAIGSLQTAESRSAVLVFTEVVDSIRVQTQLGAAAYRDAISRHDGHFKQIVAATPGAEVLSDTGTGFMARFPSNSAAVSACLRFQWRMHHGNWGVEPMAVRMGIHIGDVSELPAEANGPPKLVGLATDIAARVMSLALPNQILMTRTVFDDARNHIRQHPMAPDQTPSEKWEEEAPAEPRTAEGLGSAGASSSRNPVSQIASQSADAPPPEPALGDTPRPTLQWMAHGPYRFSESEEPIDVYEVGAIGIAPLREPPDSDKARRKVAPGDEATFGWRPALNEEVPGRSGWRVVEKLGEGGFGEVWLARHDRTKELRVFKFCFDPDRLRSFKRELTLFRLMREHLGDREDIAKLLDVQVDQPPFYLESEYVASGNLAQWAERRGGLDTVSLDTRLKLLAATARTVAAAHSLGIIHKDLKPSNIFIVEQNGEPRPRLGDFGIGMLTNPKLLHEANITQIGFTQSLLLGNESSRTGTRLYAPPESLVGKPATTAGDVYALGVMLYQFATADLHSPLGQGWEEDVADELLREDILACTHRDPARRLASAADLAERLETLEQRRATREAQARAEVDLIKAQRLATERTRRLRILKTVALTSATAVLLIGGLALFSFSQWQRADVNAKRADANAKRADDKAAEADANAKRADERAADAIASFKEAVRQTGLARGNLYATHMNLVQREWDANNLAAVLDLLERWRPRPSESISDGQSHKTIVGSRTAEPGDLRGFEWYYWDRLCHSHLLELKGHTSPVMSVAFSADGKRLASASGDKTVKVWDATSGQETLTLKGHASLVVSVAFSPDGKRLASASHDHTVKVWDATSGQETLTLKGHTDGVECVAFSADGKRLASASRDQTVKVWDATSGQETLTLKGHTGYVTSVAFSADGKRLASASWDQTVKVWDATSGQVTLTFKGHTGVVWSVAFSADGKRLASASHQMVKVWDATSGQEMLTLKEHAAYFIGLAFSADGKRLASASQDGTVKVWDAASGQEMPTLMFKGHTDSRWIAFSADGKRLASASHDHTVEVWDATSGQVTLTWKGHTGAVWSVAFSADGKRLASASGDHTVKVWDATTGRETLTLKGHTSPVMSVAFSADGKRLASASGDISARNAPGEVKVWDATNDHENLTLTGHTGGITSVAFSPDGKRLVSGSWDDTVKVWDTTSGELLLTLKGHVYGVTTVAFGAEGKRLASASNDGTVKVWDATSGQETLTLNGHNTWVESMAFSADGTTLASASGYLSDPNGPGELKVWDATTGQERLTLKWHTGRVNSVAFSADGKRLTSASVDGTVKVWDTMSGHEMLTLNGPTGQVVSVAFSADGNRLASATSDGTVKVWDARPWTPELRADQEARSLLTLLTSQLPSQEALVQAIKQDTTVSEPARCRALDWAATIRNGFVSDSAQPQPPPPPPEQAP